MSSPDRFTHVLRDAVLATAAAAAVALGVNAARPGGLPLVARASYQILVPCPVAEGKVEPIAPGDPRLRARGTLVVDARPADAFAAWHLEGARSVPFDFLTPTADDVVRGIAASGAGLVVVYGDGDDPDSGRELASELALKGIRNVHSVTGGAPALGGPRSEVAPEGEVP